MPHITLMDIANDITDTLRAATVLMPGEAMERAFTVQAFHELTEGIQDLPTIQVYPTESLTDLNTTTDRTTLRVGVQHTQLVFSLRVFARQRSNLNDDMAAVLACWDAIDQALSGVSMGCKPFFDSEAVKSFRWQTVLSIYEYARVAYVGCEYVLTVEVF